MCDGVWESGLLLFTLAVALEGSTSKGHNVPTDDRLGTETFLGFLQRNMACVTLTVKSP